MLRNSKKNLVEGCYGNTLSEIEDRIQRITKNFFIDTNDFVRGGIHKITLKPLRAEDLKNLKVHEMWTFLGACPYYLKKILMNYEESEMATGDYLMSLIEKYKVTNDKKVLERIEKTFKAIDTLCKNSDKTNPYGKGWLPKPYAGIYKVKDIFECSSDQYTKIAVAVEQYYREIAKGKNKKRAKEILVLFADWWIKHDYATNYFGRCEWWKNPPHGISFILYILALAEDLTKEKKYRNEFNKMMKYSDVIVNPIKVTSVNIANLMIDCLCRLWELKPNYRRSWKESMLICWARTRKLLYINNKECYQVFRYGKNDFKLALGMRAACSGAIIKMLFGNSGTEEYCKNILLKHNNKEMFYHLNKNSHPPEFYMDEKLILSAHHFTSWLLAYWRLYSRNANG